MADEKADNPTETPLFRFIKEEWPEIEQEIKTVQVLEGDFLLYVLWALDSVKEGEKDEKKTSPPKCGRRHTPP